MFVSTFNTIKLVIPNWKTPTLSAFMEYLTREKDKLVQMGAMKPSKYYSLAIGECNNVYAKYTNKGKDRKQFEQKQKENPKPLEGASNSKRGKKKHKDKTKCTY